MIKEIKLYPQQADFFECEDTYTMFVAGIGSGKSFVGALKAIKESTQNSLGMIIAPSFKMLGDSTLRTVKDLIGEENLSLNKTSMTGILPNGAEILFRSADDPESLRGPNLNWAWIDEGGLTPKETWLITIGRMRADGRSGKVWVTTTPRGRKNWVYEVLPSTTSFHATTFDNKFTSKEWKDLLAEQYTGNFKSQELYGEFVSFEGLVYPMFNREANVRRMDPSLYDGFGYVIDEGYTNPCAILKIYFTFDGSYYVSQEFYETGKLQSEIVDYIKDEVGSRDVEVGVDAAAAGLIAELKSAGLNAKGYKGKVLDGIRKVQTALDGGSSGRPKLIVDPSCVHTIAEFESYVWEEGKDEPVKEFDHAMDALRYFVGRKRYSTVAEQTRW